MESFETCASKLHVFWKNERINEIKISLEIWKQPMQEPYLNESILTGKIHLKFERQFSPTENIENPTKIVHENYNRNKEEERDCCLVYLCESLLIFEYQKIWSNCIYNCFNWKLCANCLLPCVSYIECQNVVQIAWTVNNFWLLPSTFIRTS